VETARNYYQTNEPDTDMKGKRIMQGEGPGSNTQKWKELFEAAQSN